MAIITRDDMVKRFGEKELAERTNRDTGDSIDDAVLQKAIDDAEAEAGSYIQAAGLKLTSAPPVLVIKVCDIARYFIYDDAVSGIIEDRYKAAIDWLKAVVRNPQMLDGTALPVSINPSHAAVIPNKPDTMADIYKEMHSASGY